MPRDGHDPACFPRPPVGCGQLQTLSPRSDLSAVVRKLHISDGLITIDSNLRIVSLNRRAEDMIRLEESTAAGRCLAEVLGLGEEGRPPHQVRRIQRIMKTGETAGLPPITVPDENGTPTPVTASVTPVKDSAGSVLGAVLALSMTRGRSEAKCRTSFPRVISRLLDLKGPDTTTDALLKGAAGFTGADCTCVRLGPAGQSIYRTGGTECPASCGARDHPQMRFILDRILSGQSPRGGGFTTSGSFVMTDCEGRFSPPIEHHTLAMVPIRADDTTAGILQLAYRRPGALSRQDLVYVETAARAAGHAFRQVEMKSALRRSEERYRKLLESSPDMVAIIRDAVVHYCSGRVTDILGLLPEEVTGTQLEQYVHPRHVERMLCELGSTDEEDSPRMLETLLIDRWGRSVPVQMNIGSTEHDGGPAIVVHIRGVGHRDDIRQQLQYHNNHDQLTGLHNRRHFEAALRSLDERRDFPVSLLVGDLNGLRLTNEAFCHEEGDRLLKRVAGILRSCCRRDDVVARIGGDEFAIILPGASEAEAGRTMDCIRSKCRGSGANPVGITLSLGAATKDSPEENIMDVFRRAEERMYRNKMLQGHSVQSAMVSSLMKTLHEKSLETEEHALRLERMALEVGRRLGLTSGDLDDLALLARLHDIGKLTVPDEVLFKLEPLTRGEWEVVRKHPEVGYRIAEACPELAPVAQAILCHHEWYNGEGYPRGIKEEEIPLISRIISVVDAYDVMTQGRPYRERMSHREASAEIRNCAGTQFDPEVAAVFLEAFSERPEWAEKA